jgi:hypothetical protein
LGVLKDAICGDAATRELEMAADEADIYATKNPYVAATAAAIPILLKERPRS